MAPIQQMVHRNWLFLLIIILFLLSPVCITAETPKAGELFQKFLQSLQTVDFEGKLMFISQLPGEYPVSEARVIRKAPDKQRIEFIRPDDVSGMGMIMNRDERWRLRGGKNRERRPPLPRPPNRMMEHLPLRNVQLLLQNYEVRVLKGGSIAGRDTYLLEINPKTAGRPSRKIWMDIETGVILKIEAYDSQKRLKSLLMFSEINFNPEIDETTFRSQHRPGERKGPRREPGRKELWRYGKGKPDLEKIRKAAELDVIIPDEPPAGFVLQSVQSMKIGRRKNVHLRYTDGLNIVSVFQSPDGKSRTRKPEDKPPWRDIRADKMNIGGVECEVISGPGVLIYRWNHRDIQMTLMGELGKEEMTGIVSSFIGEGK